MAENVYIIEMIRLDNGKMEYANDYDKSLIKKLVSDMMIGDKCKVIFDLSKDDGRYSQLRRVHAIIDQIADETGMAFDEVKKEIKRRAGLYSPNDELTSFKDVSFEDLQKAIQAGIMLGEFLGMSIK